MKSFTQSFVFRMCFAVIPALVALTVFPHSSEAQEKFATDRFIVKFKDDAQDKVNSPSINNLKKKFKVKKAKHAFEPNAKSPAEAKLKQQEKFEMLKLKFSERQARAPKNAKMPDLSHVFIFETDGTSDIEQAVKEFKEDPSIEYAEPDYVMETNQAAATNDPLINDAWGIGAVNAFEAWGVTKGAGIVVAVNDTGVDYNHEDLQANIWHNAIEVINGVDDDGNGYIDDVRGWNFVSSNNDPWDDHYHGTHVAGTIAAVDNNGIGVAGVAPQAKIMPLKALSATGSGYMSDLANAIKYATDNGADVVNNSWGCSSECPTSSYLSNALAYSYLAGVVNVFASGNSSKDLAYFGPNDMEEIISVNASTASGSLAYFSNYGVLSDVTAPGFSIMSTAPNNTYRSLSGTSMAAPHAAGVAALMLANNPQLTPLEVRYAMQSSATDLFDVGFDEKTGHGLVNAVAAFGISDPLITLIGSPRYNDVIDGATKSIFGVIGDIMGDGYASHNINVKKISGTRGEWILFDEPLQNYLGGVDVTGLSSGTYLLTANAFNIHGDEFARATQFELINGAGGELPCTKSAPFIDDISDISKFVNETAGGFTSGPAIWLRNQNTIDCPSTSYTITSTLPSGWSDTHINTATLDSGKGTSLSWKITIPANLPLGQTYSTTIHVVDNADSSFSSSLTIQWKIVYKDMDPPIVEIESPADGATVVKSKRIKIDINAYDLESRVQQVVVYVDDVRLSDATGKNQTTTWDATGFAPGLHTIKAMARDDANLQLSEPVTITINLVEDTSGGGGGPKGGGGKGGGKNK